MLQRETGKVFCRLSCPRALAANPGQWKVSVRRDPATTAAAAATAVRSLRRLQSRHRPPSFESLSPPDGGGEGSGDHGGRAAGADDGAVDGGGDGAVDGGGDGTGDLSTHS